MATTRTKTRLCLPSGWACAFDFLRRVAPLLLVLQFSGAIHLVSDMVGDADECCDASENESEEGRCPPICPSCTCAHGSRPLIPAPEMAAIAPPLAEVASPLASDRRAPDAPTLAGIFHPPRS